MLPTVRLYLKQEGNSLGLKDHIISVDQKHESHVEFPFNRTQEGKECSFDKSVLM